MNQTGVRSTGWDLQARTKMELGADMIRQYGSSRIEAWTDYFSIFVWGGAPGGPRLCETGEINRAVVLRCGLFQR